MDCNLESHFTLISSQKDIYDFIDNNENALEILTSIRPCLNRYFPDSRYSLEICDELNWTTETKLLVKVDVDEEMFFNGMLNHFNDIYREISDLTEDIFSPIVLFPNLSNENYDRFENNCAISIIVQTAYFSNDFDKNMLREMNVRDIPRAQMKREIIDYCNSHPNPDLSDIVFDLRLDLFDVDDIIDEVEKSGTDLNVRW